MTRPTREPQDTPKNDGGNYVNRVTGQTQE